MALSLAVAIGAAGLAFFVASQRRGDPFLTLAAGAILGAGACLTHFVGLAAMRTFPVVGIEPLLVALSLLVSVAAASAGLAATGLEPSPKTPLRPWEG